MNGIYNILKVPLAKWGGKLDLFLLDIYNNFNTIDKDKCIASIDSIIDKLSTLALSIEATYYVDKSNFVSVYNRLIEEYQNRKAIPNADKYFNEYNYNVKLLFKCNSKNFNDIDKAYTGSDVNNGWLAFDGHNPNEEMDDLLNGMKYLIVKKAPKYPDGEGNYVSYKGFYVNKNNEYDDINGKFYEVLMVFRNALSANEIDTIKEFLKKYYYRTLLKKYSEIELNDDETSLIIRQIANYLSFLPKSYATFGNGCGTFSFPTIINSNRTYGFNDCEQIALPFTATITKKASGSNNQNSYNLYVNFGEKFTEDYTTVRLIFNVDEPRITGINNKEITFVNSNNTIKTIIDGVEAVSYYDSTKGYNINTNFSFESNLITSYNGYAIVNKPEATFNDNIISNSYDTSFPREMIKQSSKNGISYYDNCKAFFSVFDDHDIISTITQNKGEWSNKNSSEEKEITYNTKFTSTVKKNDGYYSLEINPLIYNTEDNVINFKHNTVDGKYYIFFNNQFDINSIKYIELNDGTDFESGDNIFVKILNPVFGEISLYTSDTISSNVLNSNGTLSDTELTENYSFKKEDCIFDIATFNEEELDVEKTYYIKKIYKNENFSKQAIRTKV